MKPAKYLFISILLAIVLFACKEKEPISVATSLQGGKGGNYSIAVFTKYNGAGKSSRIYFKYAADKHPGDTNLFEEKSNTMTEPGFGPHAHFNSLTVGSYYVYCLSTNNLKADTVLILDALSAKSGDIYLNLK